MARTERSPLNGRSVGVGAAVGAAAYLLGYLVTYVTTSAEIRDSLASAVVEFATGDPGTWKLVGWLFYNEHFVTTTVPGLFGGNAVNFLQEVDAFSPALFVVPPLLLLVGGLVAARAGGATDLGAGAARGALVVAGYLPLALVGTFLFVVSAGDVSAGPDAVTGVLLAGAVYPAVFGAVGGAGGGLAG